MSSLSVAAKKRNYGIDLLRIVSMLMVVILHVLGQGGILKTAEPLSVGYEIAWFLEILCYCAVNCYALVSGFVGVEARFKYSNVAVIWLQVLCYSVGIAFVAALISPKIYLGAVLEGATPIINNLYWYFTAYFCIFLFVPVFNKLINALNVKQLKLLGITIFAVFCILQLVTRISAGREPFYTNRGYSALWLGLLYILGGILKKTGWLQQLKGYVLSLLYLGVCLITWAERLVVDYINSTGMREETLKSYLTEYISPTILLSAVFLVVAFSKLETGKILSKIIAFFAPLTFGVYLIHVQKQVWEYLLKGRFAEYAELHPALLPLAVLGTAVAIFLVCALIDFARDRLFKLLKIKNLLVRLETKFLGDIWS